MQLTLQAWQLPELLAAVVRQGTDSRAEIQPTPLSTALISVPVVPERC